MDFIICFAILFLSAIVVGIITKKSLENTPAIEIVGKKLENSTTDDINEAIKYLKVVNKE